MTIRPYGAWPSPITPEAVASASVRLGGVAVADGPSPWIYWTEGRPADGGRHTIVGRAPGRAPEDLIGAPFDARSRVHEYGGGALAIADGTVCFSNDADQQVYGRDADGPPRPLTAAPSMRFADYAFDRRRRRLIAVAEDLDARPEPAAALVSIPLHGTGRPLSLESGQDFYAAPRVAPDGERLAWLGWRHPDMPWDGTDLWVARLTRDGRLVERTHVAGGPEEAIVDPVWSPDGHLYFVSDRSGWWNLCRWRGGAVEAMTDREAEFGRPHWTFGNPTYGFASAERIVCSYVDRDGWHLADLDTRTRRLEPIDQPYADIGHVHVTPDTVVFVGGSPVLPTAIVELDLATRKTRVLAESGSSVVDRGYVSEPIAIEFPSDGGRTAYGLFYSPRNADVRAPAGERPPLRVIGHGGPTAAASRAFQPAIQFWTSRGIAVLDVDYGGSTGYGRDYRRRLDGSWGVVDVADCVAGARHLVARGEVDGARLTIRGGSAGGFTTLSALTFHDTFALGACYYGVSDLEVLARDTHKFESRYLDRLVGPYPECRERYVARSPLHHVERLTRPVIFFQGLEDRVVPPSQTERMVEALRGRGVAVEYVAFEGEQHGFRRSESIVRALEAELAFYGRTLGFEPARAGSAGT